MVRGREKWVTTTIVVVVVVLWFRDNKGCCFGTA
jgi:hypothetical protein